MIALTLPVAPALAQETPPPVNAVASTGGVATAEGVSNVTTGDIVTGLNTGHSVETGGTTNGDLIVTVDSMSSAADLAVIAEVGPHIADASGGDEGNAETGVPGPIEVSPEIDVNIDNRNDNRSDAIAIGVGGAGGGGGLIP